MNLAGYFVILDYWHFHLLIYCMIFLQTCWS